MIEVELSKYLALVAESIGVDVEDLCSKCGEDEIYDGVMCIGCLEGGLYEDELI